VARARHRPRSAGLQAAANAANSARALSRAFEALEITAAPPPRAAYSDALADFAASLSRADSTLAAKALARFVLACRWLTSALALFKGV
jgi:hypothetical protein